MLGSSPCPLLFLVTSSLIPNLPTFRFLFVSSWHRLHLLYLQRSLGIPSRAYLQEKDSQISLLLVSSCSYAPNPSASSTALMGTYSERSVIFFLCHATSHAVCQIRVLPVWCLPCKIQHPLLYSPQSSHISPAIASSLMSSVGFFGSQERKQP